jgi:hypothetical protein
MVAAEKLPPRYHDRSELTFTVPPEGTEEADFSLSSTPKPSARVSAGG